MDPNDYVIDITRELSIFSNIDIVSDDFQTDLKYTTEQPTNKKPWTVKMVLVQIKETRWYKTKVI